MNKNDNEILSEVEKARLKIEADTKEYMHKGK